MDVLPQDSASINQKKIKQILQQNNVLTDRNGTKYLLQINPTPPPLKAQLTIHKEDLPMLPVLNHINSPAYKIAKLLRKKLSAFGWYLIHIMWTGYRSRYSDCLQAGRSGDRTPVGWRFSAPVQAGPEVHPACCTMGTGSFPGVRCGRGVTLTPHQLLVPRSKIE